MAEAEHIPAVRFVPPPHYTPIPDLLIDEIMPVASGAEWKVTVAICRETFGWQRTERLLSNQRLCELTGLSRQSVTNGLREAEERGFVGKRHIGGNQWVFGLRVQKLDTAQKLGSPKTRKPSGVSCPKTRKPSNKRRNNNQQRDKQQRELKTDDVQKVDSREQVIEEIFEAWRTGTEKTNGSKLDPHRRKRIGQRLDEAVNGLGSLEEGRRLMLEAVAGMVGSEWHRERGHQNFDQLFRKWDRIEAFVQRFRAAAKGSAIKAEKAIYNTTKRNPELEAGE